MGRSRQRLGSLAALLTGLAIASTPGAALACAVCYGGNEGPLLTYFVTGVLLSALPLGMIGAIGVWFHRRARARGPAAPPRPD